MEDTELQEKTSVLGKLANIFKSRDEDDEEDEIVTHTTSTIRVRPAPRVTVTVRKNITSFDEALAAADGLKRGEQQIINLANTEPQLRQKIVDFMSGVYYAQDGRWEEIGEDIYLVAASDTYIEMAPTTSRSSSYWN